MHERAYRSQRRAGAYLEVNRMSWKRLTGGWHELPEDGGRFLDPSHPYAADLDVFGPGSLYQFCSTAVTPAGQSCLANWLSAGTMSSAEIRARQEAVCELSPRLPWRQRLLAEALLLADALRNAEALTAWGNDGAKGAVRLSAGQLQRMRVIAFVVPALTIFAALLPGILRPMLPGFGYGPLGLLLIVEILLLLWRWKPVSAGLRAVEQVSGDIQAQQVLLGNFESLQVASERLKHLKTQLQDDAGHSASVQAGRLARIVDALGNRRHQLYVLLNILFLADWHYLFVVEKWRRDSGGKLGAWVAVSAELEALCSLAALKYGNPDWTMPQVRENSGEIRVPESGGFVDHLAADSVGHPLLGTACVTNTVRFGQEDLVALITGSNMSGKSTLLRTIGLNLVLGMAGGPVFATRLVFTPARLFTCMRTRDDVEQGISSFYAELLRIRMLVAAVDAGETVFFLLDELFKGTNSADRHAGAETLVRWLVAANMPQTPVMGMISTHDLELAELENSCPGVWNAHFQEQYREGRLSFDYRLQPGVSTTRNALWLMKLAGLPVDANPEAT
jgi:hypothetical protein